MSEIQVAMLSGAAIAIFSFLLAMAWDMFKFYREAGEQEKVVFSLLQEELSTNIAILETNQAILQKELDIIDQSRMTLETLVLLKTGFWDMAKIHPPKKLQKASDLFAKFRDTALSIEYVNESIRNRENYRLYNRALNTFNNTLKLYDQTLFKQQANLLITLRDLKAQL